MLFLMLLTGLTVTFAAETAVAPSSANENSVRVVQALQLMTRLEAAPNRVNKLPLHRELDALAISHFERMWSIQTNRADHRPIARELNRLRERHAQRITSLLASGDIVSLKKALREITSGQQANTMITNLLKAPKPGTLLGDVPVDSVFSEIATSNQAYPWPIPVDQMRIHADGAFVGFDAEHSSIAQELGTSGQDNGRLDVGEWIKLHIALKSKTIGRSYSTSAYPTSHDPCLIVPSGEIELVESLGEAPTYFELWVHRPFDCASNGPSSAIVELRDSRWPSPTTLRLTLNQSAAVAGQLTDVALDMDEPGSSEPWVTGYVQPYTKGELSAGFQHSIPSATHARMAMGLTQSADKVLKTAGLQNPDMARLSDRRFSANDDLDFTGQDPQTWKQNESSDPWRSIDRAITWIAVDVEVRRNTATNPTPEKPPTIAADNYTQLLDAVQPYLELNTVPAKPERPDDLLFSHGIALSFNQEKWIEDHQPSAYPTGHGYRFRRYIQVPVRPSAAPVAKAPPPVYKPKAKVAPEPEVQEPVNWMFETGVVVVQHGGFDPVDNYDEFDFVEDTSYQRMRLRGLRRMGDAFWFLTDVQYKSQGDTILVGNDLKLSELTSTIGVEANLLNSSDIVDLSPHIGLGFTQTSFVSATSEGQSDSLITDLEENSAPVNENNDTVDLGEKGYDLDGSSWAPLLDLGITLRLVPQRNVHLYGEVAYHLSTAAAPAAEAPDIMDRHGLRFGGGVGARF